MVNFVHPKTGHEFVLTMKGAEEPRIRAKFKEGTETAKTYKKSVPKSWIVKGYVVEKVVN